MDAKIKSLEQGILRVGIGKYGSQPITEELENGIIQDIENPDTPSIQKGAFLGALFLKGFESKAEKSIQHHFGIDTSQDLIKKFCKTKSHQILTLIEKILNQEEAYIVGKFLFAPNLSQEEEFDIGLITTVFRFRHETVEEYLGLLQSIEELYVSQWNLRIKKGVPKNFVIITEPFDGVKRSYLLTPIIGKLFVDEGYIPFFIVSENPDPKSNFNLYDLAVSLKAPFLNRSL